MKNHFSVSSLSFLCTIFGKMSAGNFFHPSPYTHHTNTNAHLVYGEKLRKNLFSFMDFSYAFSCYFPNQMSDLSIFVHKRWNVIVPSPSFYFFPLCNRILCIYRNSLGIEEKFSSRNSICKIHPSDIQCFSEKIDTFSKDFFDVYNPSGHWKIYETVVVKS